MSQPRERYMVGMQRLARYLVGKKRLRKKGSRNTWKYEVTPTGQDALTPVSRQRGTDQDWESHHQVLEHHANGNRVILGGSGILRIGKGSESSPGITRTNEGHGDTRHKGELSPV